MKTARDTEFTRVLYKTARDDLIARLGEKEARELIRSNMDVAGTPGGYYFLHWLPDGDIITEELYQEKRCSNSWEGKAEAIVFLIEKLNERHEAQQKSEELEDIAKTYEYGQGKPLWYCKVCGHMNKESNGGTCRVCESAHTENSDNHEKHILFRAVQNKEHWKLPTRPIVLSTRAEAEKYAEAIGFFVGGYEINETPNGRWIVTSRGYYHYVGA